MGPGRAAAWTALGAALGPAGGRPAAARGWKHLCLCRQPSVSRVWGSLRAVHRSSCISLWEQVLPEKILRGEAVNVSSSWRQNSLGEKHDCLFAGAFGGCGAGGGHGGEKLSLQDIAEMIRTKTCQRVVVMVGAGISTPSGIPDFRSPGSGLYSNLEQYDLPYPEAIFELDYFFHNPKPFFTLAKELYPGNYRPNLAHYFLRLLHDKGLLLRLYTQNIDGLERAAGIPATKLVEAHGTFASATCTVCRQSFPGEEFHVEPFASLSQASRRSVPRLLINRELVGPFAWQPRHSDVAQLGDIIGGVETLVKALGWTEEIEDLVQRETDKDAL
ncbi:NAD-dependent protein deacetylase sirtuin-3, mitochondrial isoform X2 [Trichosurus vulpecula]|uniref:NAD-dependent protein deacetylase sirtuin-3, mitochondrial isoform X2 n=1 Tax=Trichosurus vulpecula TaxID=9337 RepID=UPI00186B1FB2|nr:NAD-dependent protein deacetylase sirtuin-3, mitochondrial isoform X2 [Trichosurus vulpecula]